jgi:WD40 repeat protein
MDEPVVPTVDLDIRCALRYLREPIHLFGESMLERRGRLRKVMIEGSYHTVADIVAQQTMQGVLAADNTSAAGNTHLPGNNIDLLCGAAKKVEKKLRPTHVLSKGPVELQKFRESLAEKTMQRAAQRINSLKSAYVSRQSSQLAPLSMSESRTQLACMLSVRNTAVRDEHARNNDEPLCAKFSVCAASDVVSGLFATGCSIGVVTVWDGERPTVSSRLHVSGGYGPVQAISMHPTQPLLVAAARNNKHRLSVVDYSSVTRRDNDDDDGGGGGVALAQPVATIDTSHAASIKDVAIDATGTLLAAASEDTTLSLWDIAAGSPVGSLYVQDGHDEADGATRLAFHPDGSLLVSADEAGTIIGWDMRTGGMVFALPAAHRLGCWSLATSPCGVLLSSGGGDNFVHLWDLRKLHANQTAASPVHTLAAHHDIVTSISLTSAGSVVPREMVTTSLDGTCKLWDCESFICTQTLPRHQGGVRGHCWVVLKPPATPSLAVEAGDDAGQQRRRSLVTVSRDYYWRAWCDKKFLQHDDMDGSALSTVIKETGAAAETKTGCAEIPATTAIDDDDDDEMEVLRRKKLQRLEPPQPTSSARLPPALAEEDDDDEMAMLRRHR